MTIKAVLKGTFDLTPATSALPPESGDSCHIGFGTRTSNQTPTKENGSKTGDVASPSGFVALPLDANMRGTVLQIEVKGSAALDVQVTGLTSGSETISAVGGLFVLERTTEDAITAVSVQGTASFQWQLTGRAA